MNTDLRLSVWLGLGNPDVRYQNTRHNIGWMFCDHVAHHLGISFVSSKHGQVAQGHDWVLLKLSGYMNESGGYLQRVLQYYKWPLSQVLVVHDDIDFPVGVVKLRCGGSDGGHRGVGSIIETFGTMDFWRMRIGIRGELPPFQTKEHKDQFIVDYVLSSFTTSEKKVIGEMFAKTMPHISDIRNSPKLAMNKINKG